MPYSYNEYNELLEINYAALDEIDILKYLKDPKESKATTVSELMARIETDYNDTKLTKEDYPELKGDIFYFIGVEDFVDYFRNRYSDKRNTIRIEEVSFYQVINLEK